MLAQIGIPILLLIVGYVLYIFTRPIKTIEEELHINKRNNSSNVPGMYAPRGSKRKNTHR
jgi:TM2 domain-containing membrane protein YozV